MNNYMYAIKNNKFIMVDVVAETREEADKKIKNGEFEAAKYGNLDLDTARFVSERKAKNEYTFNIDMTSRYAVKIISSSYDEAFETLKNMSDKEIDDLVDRYDYEASSTRCDKSTIELVSVENDCC